MNSSKNIFFVVLLSGAMALSNASVKFTTMHAFDEYFEQQMEDLHQSMKQMRKQLKNLPTQSWSAAVPTPRISIESNDKNTTVTIAQVEMNNVEAQLNDANNQLTITTPTKKIILATRDNIVNVEAQETIQDKKTACQDEKAPTSTSEFFGTSVVRTIRSVNGKLLLDKQTIDYNPVTKELIITIPLEQAQKKGKIIPINTLSSPKAIQKEPQAKNELPTEK